MFKDWPHLLQKLASAAFSTPHLGQFIDTPGLTLNAVSADGAISAYARS
jgi:hypothetical protein